MKYSLLYPKQDAGYKILSQNTMHDLGFDNICKQLSNVESEQNMILNIMSKMYADGDVISYRCDVFEDIINNKDLREELLESLDKIKFLKDYGSFGRGYDESETVWDLMHRLDEINDYIKCVDSLHDVLQNKNIHSKGLKGLHDYIENIYKDNGFAQLKSDISKLKFDTASLKSITVGINLNDRFEASGIGLISVNNKYFTKSSVISNFCDHIASKDKINSDTEWNGDYKYHQIEPNDAEGAAEVLYKMGAMTAALKNPMYAATGVAALNASDGNKDITLYMNRAVNQVITSMVKNLKEILSRYVGVTITDMTDLIPELIYYVKWAEYIEKISKSGAHFSKASVISEFDKNAYRVKARGIYNIKLAVQDTVEGEAIVTNDIDFDDRNRTYILTGANRGGKTTITQAVGQLFVLAQGGIYIPGDEFEFAPVDCIYTHFPADEDKTFDLGRLGEECKRFKEMYSEASDKSLLLMNETFSTTSFEEGYFIAKDSVKAILDKGIRTIYNTHMHKLALELESINDKAYEAKAQSLIVCSEDGERSYRIKVAAPTGHSYANDIAQKYGVTYEQLIQR